MLIQRRFSTASVILAGLLTITAQNIYAASCGKVTIADMNWASAEFAAHLDAFILENGYGCDVEIVSGDPIPTTTSMIEKGRPDVASELWPNSTHEVIEKAKKEGGKLVVAANIVADGGEQGWWIPEYTTEKHPELKTVQDVLERPDLFPHLEDKSRGGFMTCPAGWNYEVANGNLTRAYEFDKHGFDMIDPGFAAGLDGSIAKAFEHKENWFGYYWAPTAILGRYPMHKLDFDAPYDAENWESCIAKPDCPNPKRSKWAVSEANTLVTSEFAEKAPAEVMDYLEKRSYKNKMLEGILAWMSDNQASGADSAERFLKNHEDLWTKWVSADAAAKIKKAL